MFFYVTLVTYYTRQHNYVKGLTLADRIRKMQTLPEYLTKRYLAWQADEGERKTLEDYARYLGVNRSLLSYWMNGSRVPSDENVKKLALKVHEVTVDRIGKHLIGRVVYYHAPEVKKKPLTETVPISRPPVGAPIYRHSISFEGIVPNRGRPRKTKRPHL